MRTLAAPAAPAAPVAEVSVAVDEPAEPEHAEELTPSAVSPVLELPNISYPEITPAEEPVTAPAGAARSLGPLQLAVAAVVLAAGAYGMMSVFGPSRGAPAPASAPAVADRSALPKVESRAATRPAAPARTPVATPQPATSGFAPALEPRAIVSSPSNVAAKPSGTVVASADSSIAPAPVEVDLTVPSLPAVDSLVAAQRQRGDSAAIKRILRAVSGGKDVPQRP
jgi:ribonuclease E